MKIEVNKNKNKNKKLKSNKIFKLNKKFFKTFYLIFKISLASYISIVLLSKAIIAYTPYRGFEMKNGATTTGYFTLFNEGFAGVFKTVNYFASLSLNPGDFFVEGDVNVGGSICFSDGSCLETADKCLMGICSECSIGDTGPAGGKIFYRSGSTCYEAHTSDQPTHVEWGCYETSISGADGTAIGTGYQNTQDILSGCAERPIAASVCDSYTGGGKSDWFLPSRDLLNQMYLQRSTIGGFTTNSYWSSYESSSNVYAWLQRFSDGYQDYYYKNTSLRVRCARSF